MEEKPDSNSFEQNSLSPKTKLGWKKLLIEFIFVFLAITGGFLLDSFRQDQEDRINEKKIMTSLLKDLEIDRPILEYNSEYLKITLMGADSLIAELSKKPLQGREKRLYHFLNLQNTGSAIPFTDRTIVQLKYSGEFRVIQHQVVADAIVAYEKRIVDARFGGFYGTFHTNNAINNLQLLSKIFDMPRAMSFQAQALAHIDEIEKVGYPSNLILYSYDDQLIAQLRNFMFFNTSEDKFSLAENNEILEMNKSLDSLIRKIYF